MADNETIADIIAEMRDEAARADMEQDYSIDDAAEMMREFAWRIEAAHKRERRLLKSCARWILCYDIYGHTAKELLAECKEVLNDNGQFLFKENEQ